MMASQTTLDEKFLELLNAKQLYQKHPKIQKVPHNLRNKKNHDKYYSPKAVAIGPIHHDNKNLKVGDNYKLTVAAKYIQKTKQTPQFLHKKIADNISEVKLLFADDVLTLANNAESLKGFRSLEEKLSWLLFVDGCFLLCLMVDPLECLIVDRNSQHDKDLNIGAFQLLFLLMKDVLLLENQLPYLVLKLLCNDNENELIEVMAKFLQKCDWVIKKEPVVDLSIVQQPPIHLLDLQRKLILAKSNLKEQFMAPDQFKLRRTYKNIEDLTAIGIKLKSSGTQRSLDVNFSEGWFTAELFVPEIVVDGTTIAKLLNLTAYEMCPDFENNYEICSFVIFMDSLIDHAEDVKKLRSEGILGNLLGRDEEVADLFNILSTDLENNPFIYDEIKCKIDEHRSKKYKIWLALGRHTYFSNPWAIIGFLAGVIALVLTFLQTWFSIKQR